MSASQTQHRADGRWFHVDAFGKWSPTSGSEDQFGATQFPVFVREARAILADQTDDEIDDLAHFAITHAQLVWELKTENFYLYRGAADAFCAGLFLPEVRLIQRLSRPVAHYFAAILLREVAQYVLAVSQPHSLLSEDGQYAFAGSAIRYLRLASAGEVPFGKQRRGAATPSELDVDSEQETNLNIIGALITLMTEKTNQGKANPYFGNQEKVISDLLERFGSTRGIKKSTLKKRCVDGKRSLEG